MGSDLAGPMTGNALAPPDKEARLWAAVCHAAAFTFFVTGIGYILAPALVWFVMREQHPFIDSAGREAINFQLSTSIYALVLAVVSMILFVLIIGFIVVPLLVMVFSIGWIVLVAIAALKAYGGQPYRYPFTIRFI